ncbi:SDR family oxidoreductase [Sphingobium estronivorans]|uniref:SDR family oxidoreductase n=1 Tax=Sphingobium estronivorans TaxID=1577690 RepID=UPI00123B5C78|nr:SDR family oxidoreductase [Sphingobium estronivorans]
MVKPAIERRLALVTGGCGGIGIACARQFGQSHDLLLVDISRERLATVSAQLGEEGYGIAGTLAGDLAASETQAAIAGLLADHGPLGVVVHAAGIAHGVSDWQTVIRTNALGTMRLLETVEPFLVHGTVGLLIASVAGHLAPANREGDALLDAPWAPDLMDRIEPILTEMANDKAGHWVGYSDLSGPAYGLSKRATIRAAALRSAAWAERGARILSISPGIIYTPMARRDMKDGKAAAAVLAQTPLRRWGTPMDIARTAAFLASEDASFITGTDIRVDGGMIPVRLGAAC